jgi:hypothetical protein
LHSPAQHKAGWFDVVPPDFIGSTTGWIELPRNAARDPLDISHVKTTGKPAGALHGAAGR